jgi:threonine/homoserine/homoserine lactone efflux protein
MSELLPPWSLLTAFVAASLVLAVTPGPGVLYIVARSLTQGRSLGLASVAGVALGNLCSAIAAAIGLAALFAVSSAAFLIVKYAGAVYLIYLGIKTLRTPSRRTDQDDDRNPGRRVLRDGFWVALLNPKTTMFFAAFLPQFMRADASPIIQGSALGVLFVVIAAITDSAYALAAGTAGPVLRRSVGIRTGGRYLTAGTFIGLGVFAALSGERSRQ